MKGIHQNKPMEAQSSYPATISIPSPERLSKTDQTC